MIDIPPFWIIQQGASEPWLVLAALLTAALCIGGVTILFQEATTLTTFHYNTFLLNM